MRHRNSIIMAYICSVLLVTGQFTYAGTSFFTGNKLKEKLESSSLDVNMGFGYVTGVHDTLTGNKVCSPNDVKLGQVSETVLNYLNENPQLLHKSAELLVFNALSTKWPCIDPESVAQSGEFFTGNNLKEKLLNSSVDYSLGLGYVTGVHDMLSGVVICSPVRITAGQISEMTLKYFRENPGMLHLTADRLVGRALINAWPCPDQQTPPKVAQPLAPVKKAKSNKPKEKKKEQEESPF